MFYRLRHAILVRQTVVVYGTGIPVETRALHPDAERVPAREEDSPARLRQFVGTVAAGCMVASARGRHPLRAASAVGARG